MPKHSKPLLAIPLHKYIVFLVVLDYLIFSCYALYLFKYIKKLFYNSTFLIVSSKVTEKRVCHGYNNNYNDFFLWKVLS